MIKNFFISIAVFFSLNGCTQNPNTMTHKHTNALIHETSPYLLQHAHNPVNWEAWSPNVLEKAKKKNKPLLISIGYAACHWCHVMEHESFEDEEVAKVMNTHFIPIKIDREEHPDIDHIYMDAIQMMTGRGGWPLNIVALPDGKPFWGATYVKKREWISVLKLLGEQYKKQPEKAKDYAHKLSEGIKAINIVENQTTSDLYSLEEIQLSVKDWSSYLDTFLGGYKRAPKFMMPVNLNFLLHYAITEKDDTLLEYVNTTLTKMAWGGIFDPIDGGFSRYAVDTKWHIPHFEKMLYDNGQLVSLYAKAYAATKNELYKKVVEQTIAFVRLELTDASNGFYSSLDADSLTKTGELKEGAYYVWQEAELKLVLGNKFKIFKDYFNINSYGHWEDDNYVLIRDATAEEIAKKHNINIDELNTIIDSSLQLLKTERNKRNKPRLDDKILTSWNGLMLKGLVDAYRYLGNENDLELALKNAHFINTHLARKDGGLYHNHKNGKSTINGYLEDYASVINAFISLYEVTFNEKWLIRAQELTVYCIKNFKDAKSGMFYFTSKKDEFIIRRTIEVADNVIPASNSILAKNLFKLSKFFPQENYENIALQMLKNTQGNFKQNAPNYANWMYLALLMNKPFYEVAIVGDAYHEKAKKLLEEYAPNIVIAATQKTSTIELLKNRFVENSTLFYVCQHGACKLPVSKIKEVLPLLQVNYK